MAKVASIKVKMANGETKTYVQSVALIHTKHPSGCPALITIIEPDGRVDLAGDEEFMTMWIPEEMTHA